MIVTIDGPAGSGKSTVARELAARLGIPFLDTGAMYRAVAHAALSAGVSTGDAKAIVGLAARIKLDLDCGPTHTRVLVDGHDVSDAIRTIPVSTATSEVARIPGVRALLVAHQRRIGASLGSLVAEGRDQGSVVFPHADAKFVLEASIERRAARRGKELAEGGSSANIEMVMEAIRTRDASDSKHWAPLLESGEGNVLDTTNMTIEEVVARLVELLGGKPPA